MGNTIVNKVRVGDVDGDESPEIVTGDSLTMGRKLMRSSGSGTGTGKL